MTRISGDVIPDCELFLPTGERMPLSNFATDALLVIFLRHLM
jgi:hypothetical protein